MLWLSLIVASCLLAQGGKRKRSRSNATHWATRLDLLHTTPESLGHGPNRSSVYYSLYTLHTNHIYSLHILLILLFSLAFLAFSIYSPSRKHEEGNYASLLHVRHAAHGTAPLQREREAVTRRQTIRVLPEGDMWELYTCAFLSFFIYFVES